MNAEYRFTIQLGEDGEEIPVTPICKDSLSLDYAREPQQQFYRAKLSGNLTFCRQDFALINDADFETKFVVNIYKSGQPYYFCYFYKTNCKVDLDSGTIEVRPEPLDGYDEILNNMDKDIDLMKLGIPSTAIGVTNRPILQMYTAGSNKVANFLGGSYWESDCDVADFTLLESKYFFALKWALCDAYVKEFADVPELEGYYTGKLSEIGGEFAGSYTGTINNESFKNYSINIDTNPTGEGNILCVVYDNLGTRLYVGSSRGQINNYVDVQMKPQNGATGEFTLRIGYRLIFTRYVLNAEEIKGVKTNNIAEDDIFVQSRNYKKVIPYDVDIFTISARHTKSPTEYGKNVNDDYYLPPSSVTTSFYPYHSSSWELCSIWFSIPIGDTIVQDGSKEYTLPNSYKISDVLSALMGKYAPNFTHKGTEEYSRFLYGETNPVRGEHFDVLITPKSNVTVGEYENPAQKAETQMGVIFQMLSKAFNVYWFIDNGKLRLEHISWFDNGGSYTPNPVIGYDLTRLKNVRNGKPLSFGTSQYSYNKEEMPVRYKYEWMDDVSEIFQGRPIEVLSKFVNESKTEEINIGSFTSDVDYTLLNSDFISMDGFMLLSGGYDENGKYKIPIPSFIVNGNTCEAQNGYMSMSYLQPNFLLYSMPAYNLKVNNRPNNADSLSRNKQQTITFPVGNEDPNPLYLVKTELGDGEIEKISVNLSSRTAKATLKYDTK